MKEGGKNEEVISLAIKVLSGYKCSASFKKCTLSFHYYIITILSFFLFFIFINYVFLAKESNEKETEQEEKLTNVSVSFIFSL